MEREVVEGRNREVPPATQAEARKHWEEFDEIAHCYMLASMTNTMYKQLESCKTTKEILDKLEDMFKGQATLAR
ncbi:hypothetical protein J1N35_037721 [Gossypium stocksii]|uniref:Uncharacterized protein n=1 Tax=Gossypium stocksii TaxID=47602 RepID=A0A9D3ZM20_9ROSI|nr:hypothetical protein J1N35_037721 [Gossypium stocksii]